MRMITQMMADAFWAGKPKCRSGNGATEVYIHEGTVYLSLHGSDIARRPVDSRRLEISSSSYQTNTTKDRLNGVLNKVGAGIYQTNFVWYFSPGDGGETVEMPSRSWLVAHHGSDLEQLADVKRQVEAEKARYKRPSQQGKQKGKQT